MPYTTLVAGTTITASWANASVRDQVITPFADTTARDAAITAPVDGMYAHLTGSDTLTGYTGAAWEIVSEPPQSWSLAAYTQNGSKAATTTRGWTQRSRGVFVAQITLSSFAAGSAGNAIQIATPFTLADTNDIGGAFSYNDSGAALEAGVVFPVSTTVMGFQCPGEGSLGVSPSIAAASADTLRVDCTGRYA